MNLRVQNLDNGAFVVLAKNGVITVDLNSTLFNNPDEILGSFSYESNCPLEPNRWWMENAHLINTSIDLRTFNALILFGTRPWKRTKFNYRISNKTINYHNYIDSTIISNQLKELLLNQLVDPAHDGQINFAGYPEFQAYMMSTISAAPGIMPMVFAPFKNDGAFKTIPTDSYEDYPDIALPLDGYINSWQSNQGVGSFKVDTAGQPNRYIQSPFFYLVYLIKRIAQFFKLEVAGECLKDEAFRRIVFATNIATLPGYIPDFTYFMPDILLKDFIKEVREECGVLIDFDLTKMVLTVETIEKLELTTDIFDLRPYQLEEFEELPTSLKAYRITMGTDDKDLAFSDDEKQQLPVVTVGNLSSAVETVDVPLSFATTKMINEATPAGMSPTTWRVPYIKQSIVGSAPFDQISDRAYVDRNKFKGRFLYWHGMVPDASGYLYPYVSADNLDYNYESIAETTLALTNTGNAFLAVKRKAEFLANSKPREISFECPPNDFLKITPRTRFIIRDKNNAAVSCLMDTASADLVCDEEIIFGKITLYPIIKPDNKLQIVPVIPPPPPEPPVNNGIVFAVLELRNITSHAFSVPPPPYLRHDQDIYVRFYNDAGKTVAKDVTDLELRIRVTKVTNGDLDSAIVQEFNSTQTSAGHEVKLYNQVPADTNQGGPFIHWTYELLTTAHYTVVA
ncbi:hypothetical protein [Mucilaginibacter sp.]|uniref:hypothetical protein n=1 Tax=Mucilaginibacter sp. TaxID=1882438 RepID=UPI0035BC3D1A